MITFTGSVGWIGPASEMLTERLYGVTTFRSSRERWHGRLSAVGQNGVAVELDLMGAVGSRPDTARIKRSGVRIDSPRRAIRARGFSPARRIAVNAVRLPLPP